MTRLIMEINDFMSINEANIEINKINVVGGVNGSGKSTVSRIFYSFLKANSIHRKDFILNSVIDRANKLADAVDIESIEYNLPNTFTNYDKVPYIIPTLDCILEISKDYDEIAIIKKEEFLNKFNSFKERLIKDGINVSILEDKINSIDSDYYITHDFVDYLFEGYELNFDYLEEYFELKNLWKLIQHYRFKFHEKCLKIYSETEEFLIEDNPSINEKIFNRILLKEQISINYNKDLNLKMIMNKINKIIDIMDFKAKAKDLPDYLIEGISFDLPNHLTINDNFSDMLKTLSILSEISKDYDKIANLKKKELKKELLAKFDSIIKILIDNNIDVSLIESAFYSTNDDTYTDSEYFLHSIFEENNLYLNYSDDYYEFTSLIDSYNYFYVFSEINDRCIAIESVIHEFFDQDTLLQNDQSINELLLNEEYLKDFNNNVSFHMRPDEYDSFSYFFNNYINSVYYVDNVSIFDINHEEMVLTNRLFHMDEIIEDIYGDTYTYELNDDFKNIMNKIDRIIGGRYKQDFPYFVSDKKNDPLSFIKSLHKNLETSNTTTSSGIKQIGIVQLLLLNDKLKKDGYLIIDEPEVNLHPEWQFKFAEILVLLAKELNITIYLNSHSPMFIEAIDAFAEFYDMSEDVNYYLTEESEIEGKYNFKKINSNELYRIYDNLGNAYDLIDQLRLRKHLGD